MIVCFTSFYSFGGFPLKWQKINVIYIKSEIDNLSRYEPT